MNEQNLKPWKPGESGNGKGRPRTKPISDAYRALLNDPKELKKFARALMSRAQDGDVAAAREICDRVEGKVKETLELLDVSTLIREATERVRARVKS